MQRVAQRVLLELPADILVAGTHQPQQVDGFLVQVQAHPRDDHDHDHQGRQQQQGSPVTERAQRPGGTLGTVARGRGLIDHGAGRDGRESCGQCGEIGLPAGVEGDIDQPGQRQAGQVGIRCQPGLHQPADLLRRHDAHEGDAIELLQVGGDGAGRRVRQGSASGRGQRHGDDLRLQRQPACGAAGGTGQRQGEHGKKHEAAGDPGEKPAGRGVGERQIELEVENGRHRGSS